MLGPPPCLPLNSSCQFGLTSPFLMCRGQGPSSLPIFLRVVSQCSLLALSTSARALRTQGTIHLCRIWVFSLCIFFPFLSPLSKTAWRLLLPLSPRQFQRAHLVPQK